MLELDLHGTNHNEAQFLVDQFIYKGISRGEHEIRVITGNSDRMREITMKSIKDHGLDFTVGDPYNMGYIRIFL
jgi:DNA-nicking Smr family endonuclease